MLKNVVCYYLSHNNRLKQYEFGLSSLTSQLFQPDTKARFYLLDLHFSSNLCIFYSTEENENWM